jgi:UPF0755 protein
MIALLVIFGLLAGGGYFVYHIYSLYQSRHAVYSGSGYGSVTITVRPGDSADGISSQLLHAGVIAAIDPWASYVATQPNMNSLQPGQYKLHLHMSPAAAWALLMNPKSRVNVRVTVIDGTRYTKFLPLLARESGIPLSDFEAAIKNTAALGLPPYANGNPEGYLWPATYDVAPGETALKLLQTAVTQFKKEAVALHLAAGASRTGFTEAHLVIIASLLMAEVNQTKYYADVARVIDNRLKAGMTLGLDSTVAYALNKYTFNLTTSDLNVNSPYNTRKFTGLPPGPIDSPNAAAIQAAMNPAPATNTWLYFVTVNKQGLTLFTSDPNQFQTWVAEAHRNGL